MIQKFLIVVLGLGLAAPAWAETTAEDDAAMAPADKEKAAEMKKLEEDMKAAHKKVTGEPASDKKDGKKDTKKDAKKDGDQKKAEAGAAVESKETGDWAGENRWNRYKGRAKKGSHEETGDWADKDRWNRYKGADGAQPVGLGGMPRALQYRSPGGALALGGLVGFGSGFYYSSNAPMGIIFSAVDAALIWGFVVSELMLNRLVVEHDLEEGLSLLRGERDWGTREQNWASAAMLFAFLEGGSRVFQAIGSFREAKKTNRVLERVMMVPAGPGGPGATLQIWF